ncbi:MAG TPA: transketolase C-terminal domain-containing protein [Blastocatellia bacterium]|nr:transketolase C-terminal domain-containing protein [Blastocatellia bacterium]
MTYEETLGELARTNDNLVVMTAENRAAIRNLPHVLGERFIDVGIAEQTLVGAAAGLALRGRTPVVHALSAFLVMRSFEFIRTDVGLPGLPVKLVGSAAGFLSEANGPTHQAIEDIALMRVIPNMQIVCPSDEAELTHALPKAIESRFPCYIRYNASKPATSHGSEFEFGKAELVSDGSDVSILTYGLLLKEALAAADILRAAGVSARVVNLRTLKPIDEKTILAAARETAMIVTIEDHFQTGGLYSIVAELLLKSRLTADVLPIAFNDRWFRPALLDDAIRFEGFAGDQIARRILGRLQPVHGTRAGE